jgi:hypothetical protein
MSCLFFEAPIVARRLDRPDDAREHSGLARKAVARRLHFMTAPRAAGAKAAAGFDLAKAVGKPRAAITGERFNYLAADQLSGESR